MTSRPFNPNFAIVAATSAPAQVLGIDTGLLAPGKRADFLVLDANPMYGVTNTRLIFDKQLRLQGFLNSEFRDQWDRDRAELENLVASGKLKYRETVAQGLKSAPQAFIGMLQGENLGKQLVKLT